VEREDIPGVLAQVTQGYYCWCQFDIHLGSIGITRDEVSDFRHPQRFQKKVSRHHMDGLLI
jgi:hypothetical protein